MKIENICTKRTYEKDGQEKTVWLNVGVLKTAGNGKKFIELSMFPNTPFFVFEQKAKEEKPKQAASSEFDEFGAINEVPF